MREGRTTPRSFNWSPELCFTLLFNQMTQEFHTKDKNVRRKRVSLPNTSRRTKRIKAATIEEKGCRNRGNAAHNDFNKRGREVEVDQHFPNKAPLNPVISFLKINLNSHKSLTTIGSSYNMDQLLNNNNIINTSSSWNKSSLIGRNEMLQMRSKPSNNNLGDDLIGGITQTNRSVITNGFWALNFWNKNNKGSIKIFENLPFIEDFFHFLCNRIPNHMPKTLKNALTFLISKISKISKILISKISNFLFYITRKMPSHFLNFWVVTFTPIKILFYPICYINFVIVANRLLNFFFCRQHKSLIRGLFVTLPEITY